MIYNLWPTRVAVTKLGYSPEFLSRLKAICLRVDAEKNPRAKPWTRQDYDIYNEPDPELAILKRDIIAYAEKAYGVEVDQMTGRDMILRDRDLIPPHSDRDSHLSAIFYIQTPVIPKPQEKDWNGFFILQDPSRYFDARQMPWEPCANHVIAAEEGVLVLFPSHICHFTHTMNHPEMQIEMHHELKVKHVHNSNVREGFHTEEE